MSWGAALRGPSPSSAPSWPPVQGSPASGVQNEGWARGGPSTPLELPAPLSTWLRCRVSVLGFSRSQNQQDTGIVIRGMGSHDHRSVITCSWAGGKLDNQEPGTLMPTCGRKWREPLPERGKGRITENAAPLPPYASFRPPNQLDDARPHEGRGFCTRPAIPCQSSPDPPSQTRPETMSALPSGILFSNQLDIKMNQHRHVRCSLQPQSRG